MEFDSQQFQQPQQSIMHEILIPGHKCGLIIGKGGETIRKLQENSHTEMQLIQQSNAPTGEAKPLQIVGPPECVEVAKRMVEQLLESDDNRMPNGAATGANRIEMSQAQGIARLIVPRSAVGFIIGKGGEMVKRISQESGAQVQFEKDVDPTSAEASATLRGYKNQIDRAASIIQQLVQQSNMETQQGQQGQQGQQVQNGQQNVVLMQVPVSKTGLVIGRNGSVIKKICQESGARVDLSRDPPVNNGMDNIFTIKGTPSQIQLAQQAIFAQMNDEAPFSTRVGQQHVSQNYESTQWAPVSGYDQPVNASANDQWSNSIFAATQQQDEGQNQPIPTAEKVDYSTQWIEYYRLVGMHDKADEIENLRNQQYNQ